MVMKGYFEELTSEDLSWFSSFRNIQEVTKIMFRVGSKNRHRVEKFGKCHLGIQRNHNGAEDYPLKVN